MVGGIMRPSLLCTWHVRRVTDLFIHVYIYNIYTYVLSGELCTFRFFRDFKTINFEIDTLRHCNTLQHTILAIWNWLHRAAVTLCASRNTLQHTQHNATYCNTLQHTATHCNILQHTATHCNTLQHTQRSSTATHCNALQHTSIHCNAQCVTVCCSVLPHALQCAAVRCRLPIRCGAVRCSVFRCVAVRCSVVQCAAVRRNLLQCAAMRCSVLQYTTMCCSVLQTSSLLKIISLFCRI